jgi:hypothetical protein
VHTGTLPEGPCDNLYLLGYKLRMIVASTNVPKRTRPGSRPPLLMLLRVLVGLVALGGVAGCGGAVDFTSWVTSYNNSVDQAQNKLLLLNVMRASGNMPLLFTGVQVVRGNGATSSGVTVGGVASNTSASQLGTQSIYSVASTVTPGVTLSVTDGFNFDVAILDTAEFYTGLLTPISVDTFHYYSSQGIPSELLLNLFVERMTVTEDGVAVTYVNNPATPGYTAFRSALDGMLKAGISTEIVVSQVPVGPLLHDADLKDIKSLIAGAQANLFPAPVPGGYRMMRAVKFSRFCFMATGADAPILPQSALCAASPKRRKATIAESTQPPNRPSEGELALAKSTLLVQTRSTRDLFSYLGMLVRGQTEAGLPPLPLHTTEAENYNALGKGPWLFRVIKDHPQSDDLASINYLGSTYSVPRNEQGHSATVMALMMQLLSLSKSINSIPNTGTVVVH